jgi:hypothetical protein
MKGVCKLTIEKGIELAEKRKSTQPFEEMNINKSLSVFQFQEILSVAQRRALTFCAHNNKRVMWRQ